MNRIMKHFCKIFLLTLIVLNLNAGGEQEDVKSNEPVEIQFWTRQVQSERQEQIRALIDVFEIMNPDIKVSVLPVEDNEFATQLAAAGEATRPSLIETGFVWSMSFNEEGLVDSQANENVIESVGAGSFYPGSLDNVKGNDNRYFGIPFHYAAQGIWYRKDWFAEAGLEPPATWESLLKAAKYFHSPSDKQYGILIGTKPENYTQQVFTHLATSNNAHLFNIDGELDISSPEFKETVEFYNELSKYTPPGPQTWRARDYYIQGKMAMFYYSTYIMDDLAKAEVAASSLTGDNFSDLDGGSFDENLVKNTGFVPIISKTDKTGYGEIITLSVLKKSDSQKTRAAERLAAFFLENENYIPYLHIAPGGMLAVKSDVIGSDEFLNDPFGIYLSYGKDKIDEITEGLGNIQDFLTLDGISIPESSTILSKNLISQMLYNITIENRDIDSEIASTEKKILKLIE